jgi:hypothetical protein
LFLQVNTELGVVQENHNLDADEVDKSCSVRVLGAFECPFTLGDNQAIDFDLVLSISFCEVD